MTLVLRTRSNKCWFWYIPLSDDVVSVGVVGDAIHLLQGRGTPDQIFAEEVADCPSIAERLEGAEKIAGLDVVKEYSYTTEQAAGDGWVFVGDAWGFIDPLYSSGVFFALEIGPACRRLHHRRLAEERPFRRSSSASGRPSSTSARTGSASWCSRFTPASSASASSSASIRSTNATMTDILIGRIFYPEAGGIFDDLDPWLAKNEGTRRRLR